MPKPGDDPLHLRDIGVVTAAGAGLDALWAAALDGRPLAAPVARYDTTGLGTRRAALIPDAIVPNDGRDRALAAALASVVAAPDPRAALIVGTSLGGVASWEPWHRALVAGGSVPPAPPIAAHDDLAPALARALKIRGPVVTVSSACTSGAAGLILAADMIRAGEVDEALVIAVDVLGRFVHAGFDRLGALCPDDAPPAPFAEDRAGMWLGEAAASVHIARGDGPLRYLGGATSGDGVHMTAPDREGRGMARAIAEALRDAGVTPHDIAWVSAHATATRFNDAMEATALQSVFNQHRPPVHALKPVIGHTLGASGLVEVALAAEALRRRTRPPTRTRRRDPALADITLDEAPAALAGRVALSINAAMAGHNSAVLLGGAP